MTIFTSQPDESVGIDTFISDLNPTTNYGTSSRIEIGEADGVTSVLRGLIKFDLTSIPASAVVLSATLSLWTEADYSINTRTLRAYRVLRNWVESQATWNIFATSNNWGTAGCANTSSDREATDIGSVSVLHNESANIEKQISLTPSKVQEWISGAVNNYGLLLKMDTESNDAWRWHSASAATPDYRPKLVIEYLESGRMMQLPTFIG